MQYALILRASGRTRHSVFENDSRSSLSTSSQLPQGRHRKSKKPHSARIVPFQVKEGNPRQRTYQINGKLQRSAYYVSPPRAWVRCRQHDLYYRHRETCSITSLTTPCTGPCERVYKNRYVCVLGKDESANEHHWTAYVLDIRSRKDRLWLHIMWLYRPEDLPQGRQNYHSTNELVMSTHEQIIDSTSVLQIQQVDRFDEKTVGVPSQGLYWRQLFDLASGRLSSCERFRGNIAH